MKSISYVRKKLGVSAQTVRNYIKDGKLKAIKSPTGRYIFDEKDIDELLSQNNLPKDEIWAFYLRSSAGDKVLLQNQEKNLRDNYPEPKYIFKDSASGLNDKRVNLKRLKEKIKNKEVTDVAITQEDRLSRFGVSFLVELFESYGAKVHFLYKTNEEKDLQEELMKDFMSLIASFSGKYYRLRSLENKKRLLKEAEKFLDENNKSL